MSDLNKEVTIDDIEQLLVKLAIDLRYAQVDLSPEERSILYANLWDLYYTEKSNDDKVDCWLGYEKVGS